MEFECVLTACPYSEKYFCENLKEIIYRMRLKQTEAAEMIGVEPPQLNNWTRGLCTPTVASLARICNGLGVVPEMLLLPMEGVKYER